MSVVVMSWVFLHAPRGLSAAEMLVALVLAEHANADGGLAYPSVDRMVNLTRLGERTVRRALGSLVDKGVITVHIEATNRRPTVYEFPAFRGAKSAPQENARGAKNDAPGCRFGTSRGANLAKNGGRHLLNEPSIEPSIEPSDLAPSRGPYTAEFEAFWSRYPRTNGSKADAFKVWQSMNAKQREAASAGLQKWIDSDHWADGFIVFPQKFLRSRLYDSDPVPKGRNGRSAVADGDYERQLAELKRIGLGDEP